MKKLIECDPNFSERRDRKVINVVFNAAKKLPGRLERRMDAYKTAKHLSEAVIKSFLENIKINMQLIKDTGWKEIILPLVAELE